MLTDNKIAKAAKAGGARAANSVARMAYAEACNDILNWMISMEDKGLTTHSRDLKIYMGLRGINLN